MASENPVSVPPPLPATATPVRWQYVTVTMDVTGIFNTNSLDPQAINDTLDWYGSQGWELVSTFDTAGRNGGTMTVAFIFKRPLPG